ncbi:MAG: hypothetical protein LWW98_08570 [Deltaproteobacteria bacterium]|nr:hypothetical protein [Deltaproteobacteria bacterium]
MEQIRVNLTLEKEIWISFGELVPNRKKSKIINQLLNQEIKKINRQDEERLLASAFQEAAKDKNRLKEIDEWGSLDIERWD